MADAPKQSSFGSSYLPVRPGLRRDKPQLACVSCRSRKVKCDRGHPCQNCTRRGQAATCTFADPQSRRRPHSSSSEAQTLTKRITQLEGMLRSIIEPNPDLGIPVARPESYSSRDTDHSSIGSESGTDMNNGKDKPLDNNSLSPGQLNLDDGHANYVSSAHWAAILTEVVSLKDLLGSQDLENSSSFNEAQSHQEIDLLFSTSRTVTQSEILASIPAKDIVDRLISRYFSVMDMALTVLHIPTFQREYEKFWLDPSGVSPMWLSVLFSMMSMSEQFASGIRDGSPEAFPRPQIMMHEFRKNASECLILGNYTKPTEFVLEALLHYYAIEQYRSSEDHFGNSILMGLIVRMAMRMGYHMDPSRYPNISVLRGEMRRRVWSTIVIADIVSASQVGLPKLINQSQTDTKIPHNILDEDIDEQSTELPALRPDTENTLMSYAIMKHRMHVVFGMIGDLTTSTQAVSYTDDVMKLDRLLKNTRNLTPPALQMRSTVRSVTDSSAQILRRYALEVLYQKSRCVLHRRYLVLARTDIEYLYSRQSCVNAAMELLYHQSVVHIECQPNGLLQRESLKIGTLMVQEFLMAAMIICLEFVHIKTRSWDSSTTSEDTMLQALQKSYSIWQESATSSTEAFKAANVLKMILEKVSSTANNKYTFESASLSPDTWSVRSTNSTPLSSLSNLAQRNEEIQTLLDDDFLNLPTTQQNNVFMDPVALLNVEMIENMIYEPESMDWAVWDTYT